MRNAIWIAIFALCASFPQDLRAQVTLDMVWKVVQYHKEKLEEIRSHERTRDWNERMNKNRPVSPEVITGDYEADQSNPALSLREAFPEYAELWDEVEHVGASPYAMQCRLRAITDPRYAKYQEGAIHELSRGTLPEPLTREARDQLWIAFANHNAQQLRSDGKFLRDEARRLRAGQTAMRPADARRRADALEAQALILEIESAVVIATLDDVQMAVERAPSLSIMDFLVSRDLPCRQGSAGWYAIKMGGLGDAWLDADQNMILAFEPFGWSRPIPFRAEEDHPSSIYRLMTEWQYGHSRGFVRYADELPNIEPPPADEAEEESLDGESIRFGALPKGAMTLKSILDDMAPETRAKFSGRLPAGFENIVLVPASDSEAPDR